MDLCPTSWDPKPGTSQWKLEALLPVWWWWWESLCDRRDPSPHILLLYNKKEERGRDRWRDGGWECEERWCLPLILKFLVFDLKLKILKHNKFSDSVSHARCCQTVSCVCFGNHLFLKLFFSCNVTNLFWELLPFPRHWHLCQSKCRPRDRRDLKSHNFKSMSYKSSESDISHMPERSSHLIPGVKEHYIISGQIWLSEVSRNFFHLRDGTKGSSDWLPAGFRCVQISQSFPN